MASQPVDAAAIEKALNDEAPRSIRFLREVRAGLVVGASVADRMRAAQYLLDKAPAVMRLEAEIERTKNAPPPMAEAPKGYVRTAFGEPNNPVDVFE